MDNNEFQEYIKKIRQNLMSSIEIFQKDYEKFISNSSLLTGELAEKMKQWTSVIKNFSVSIPLSKKIEEYAKIVRETENLTEEEFEKRFNDEYNKSMELGKYGWIPSEHCTPKEINASYPGSERF